MPDKPHKPIDDKELLDAAIPIPIDDLEEIEDDDHLREHPDDDLTPIEMDDAPARDISEASIGGSMIQVFGGDRQPHEDKWSRKTNVTGKGATHVKTFYCKLRPDAIQYLDDQINEWLDKHPEYEVKQVSASVGKLVGKNIEDALFLNVWV